MTGSHLEQLKAGVVRIDDQILAILVPHHEMTDTELQKIAVLEQARKAAQRLLNAAEVGAGSL